MGLDHFDGGESPTGSAGPLVFDRGHFSQRSPVELGGEGIHHFVRDEFPTFQKPQPFVLRLKFGADGTDVPEIQFFNDVVSSGVDSDFPSDAGVLVLLQNMGQFSFEGLLVQSVLCVVIGLVEVFAVLNERVVVRKFVPFRRRQSYLQ